MKIGVGRVIAGAIVPIFLCFPEAEGESKWSHVLPREKPSSRRESKKEVRPQPPTLNPVPSQGGSAEGSLSAFTDEESDPIDDTDAEIEAVERDLVSGDEEEDEESL